jgi:dolichol-phosphate mannosyltransferase
MNRSVELSIVMPAYQEAENLSKLLPRLKQAAAGLTANYEIVVVDTAQPRDDTQQVCNEWQVRHVSRQPSDSYGDAVRFGISAARGRWIVFMDADGSHSPEMLPQLYQHRDSYDVVIASRYIAGGATENSFLLTLMSRALNVIYSVVLNLDCHDVSNSYRLYSGALLKAVPLSCANFDVVEEILVGLKRGNKRLRIKEVPFTFKQRDRGRTKRNLPLFIATFALTLLRLRLGGRRTPAGSGSVSA